MAILGQVMGYRGVAEGLPGREGYRTIPGREWVVTGPDGSTGRRVVDLWQIATALGLTSLTIVAPPPGHHPAPLESECVLAVKASWSARVYAVARARPYESLGVSVGGFCQVRSPPIRTRAVCSQEL